MSAAQSASDPRVPDARLEVAAAKWTNAGFNTEGSGRALPSDAVETCCTFQGDTLGGFC